MRALLVGNGDDFDAGFIGHRFREHGFAFTECHRERPGEWPRLEGFDLALTLGSEWNVYRPETAELVAAEAHLVRDIQARGLPLFAICFGAQVLAHALGAEVTRTTTPEIGWHDIDVSGDGAVAAVAAGPWMEWHYDVFTMPAGYAELARTAAGPQLIRGPRTLGTQFHPEVTETMVARWLRSGGAEQLVRHGGRPDDLLAETRVNVERSRPNAAALVDWFLTTVAGAGTGTGTSDGTGTASDADADAGAPAHLGAAGPMSGTLRAQRAR